MVDLVLLLVGLILAGLVVIRLPSLAARLRLLPAHPPTVKERRMGWFKSAGRYVSKQFEKIAITRITNARGAMIFITQWSNAAEHLLSEHATLRQTLLGELHRCEGNHDALFDSERHYQRSLHWRQIVIVAALASGLDQTIADQWHALQNKYLGSTTPVWKRFAWDADVLVDRLRTVVATAVRTDDPEPLLELLDLAGVPAALRPDAATLVAASPAELLMATIGTIRRQSRGDLQLVPPAAATALGFTAVGIGRGQEPAHEVAAGSAKNLRREGDSAKSGQERTTMSNTSSNPKDVTRQYDLFISHASEDKEAIARPLYEALVANGLSVWFDETTLELGDSLRRRIDDGLARCRYGVVILSPRFLAKEWPQRELDGLVARETASGEKAILPVWHELDTQTLMRYSPPLADRLAARSTEGVSAVTAKILQVVRRR